MRSKDKNKIYWLFFSAIIIASLITPYIIQKAIILGSEKDDEEESSLMMIPLTPTPSNYSFPDDSFSFINYIDEIMGSNLTGNSTECLEALKYNDDNVYLIEAEQIIDGYMFNIEFFYNISNLNLIPSTIDFYDFYLYLEIDLSIYSPIVYLQGLNGTDWYNITEISNEAKNLLNYLINNTIKLRIYGETKSIKRISIEKLYILLNHNEKYPFAIDLTNIDEYGYTHRGGESPLPFGNYRHWLNNPNDWWTIDSYNTGHHQYTSNWIADMPHNYYAWTELIVEMEYNDPLYFAEEYTVDNWYVKIYAVPYAQGVNVREYLCFVQGRLWNYVDQRWDYLKEVRRDWWESFSPFYRTFDWRPNLDENPDAWKYLNPTTNTWKFKIYSEVWGDQSGGYPSYGDINLDLYTFFSEFDLTSIYSYYSYPIIEAIYTEPPSPISTLTKFQIKTDTISDRSAISEVSYYVEDESTEWNNMDYLSGDIWISEELLVKDFPDGEYRVWINSSDDLGYSTLRSSNFTISNAYPEVSFIKPSSEGEKIEQLYNYNVNITIQDPENNDFELPQLILYKDNISEPMIDWVDMEYTKMETLPEGNLFYYNYSFDPIIYGNNLYKIRVKTNDSREIEIFNETTINIINNPPSIEILEPSILELISPYIQEIICNITNEEPINTAEWDIVSELNGFDWKPLNFNITTEFWEGNFSLLNYEYGDYFLVINATDDKYNTSLEIKAIQIHPLLIYHIRENDISYNSIGIIAYSNPTITTDIVGQFNLNHHPIVVERDFEIYIPEKYDDAHKYYINRGFSKYEPVGFFAEGTYTLWYIPQYQTSDTVYFSLDKPIIINSLIEEEKDGTLKMEFILRSKHAFSGITINNQLSKFISDPENYEYTLQYLYAGDWEDFDEDDYEVEAEDFPSFSFVWESIGEGMEISFRFIAVPIEAEESAIGGGLLVGFVALALVELIAQIVLINRRRNRPEKWGWGKYILVSVGIGAGTFIAGFVAGLFLFG